VLNPSEGNTTLSSLGLKSPCFPGKIESIKMLGSKEKIKYRQNDDAMNLTIPVNRPTKYAAVFKVKGVL
jgi:alpha-L-fucosidase